MSYAGFWRRLMAYFIDAIPITLLVAAVFYVAFGFDKTLHAYFNDRNNPEARAAFLAQRNLIRDTSLFLYLLYATLLEASTLQGTLGKRLMGIAVTNCDGERPRFGQALVRNVTKILSFLPFGLGCLWVIWSPEKRAWHDYFAKTIVVIDGEVRIDRKPEKDDGYSAIQLND